MITITDRSRGEEFANWYKAQGIPLVLTALGNGTATTDVLNLLGLEATEKAVLFCVAMRSPRLVRRAAKDLWLDIPGRGILMTVPIASMGVAAKEYLLQGQEAEEIMETKLTHELIVAIAKQGHTDQVMNAARSAGATGGTIVHAKGAGTDLAKKFFGVSIATEREMVFILTKEENRKDIMKAIVSQAGLKTDAEAMVFSMPVSDIAGLRQLDGEE
jgi:nitrogen regulatory protein PII